MSRLRFVAVVTFVLTVTADRADAQAFSSGSNVRVGIGVGYGYGFGPGIGYRFGPGFGYGYGYGPYYGPRVGPYFGPGLWGWGWPYGWYGGYPGAVGSFWTNGLSLYGPPVPTAGPVPGSFGGGDAYRQFAGNGANGLYGPWPWGAQQFRGASKDLPVIVPPAGWNGPRFATRDVKRHYAQAKADPQGAIDRAYRDLERVDPYLNGRSPYSQQPANRLRVLVQVPADATVWLDDRPTSATGSERLFESPPLAVGKVYQYRVTAVWPGGSETLLASGSPGETAVVTFGGPR